MQPRPAQVCRIGLKGGINRDAPSHTFLRPKQSFFRGGNAAVIANLRGCCVQDTLGFGEGLRL